MLVGPANRLTPAVRLFQTHFLRENPSHLRHPRSMMEQE